MTPIQTKYPPQQSLADLRGEGGQLDLLGLPIKWINLRRALSGPTVSLLSGVPPEEKRGGSGTSLRGRRVGLLGFFPSASVFLLKLELSATKVYKPYIRALLGTDAHLCKAVVIIMRTVPISLGFGAVRMGGLPAGDMRAAAVGDRAGAPTIARTQLIFNPGKSLRAQQFLSHLNRSPI